MVEGKTVKESATTITQFMTTQDTNNSGNVHGGVIMKLIDTTGGLVAIRHARTSAVTASIDRLDFHHPVYVSDLLTLKASLNFVGRTSMEVGVRVEAESIKTGVIRHTASAYITYVSLGPDGRPIQLPPLILETEEEIRRNCEAQARREMRLKERTKEGKLK